LGSQDRDIANVISLCENRILRFRMVEKYILGAHDNVLFQFKEFKFKNLKMVFEFKFLKLEKNIIMCS
jgi:hypothetical protein